MFWYIVVHSFNQTVIILYYCFEYTVIYKKKLFIIDVIVFRLRDQTVITLISYLGITKNDESLYKCTFFLILIWHNGNQTSVFIFTFMCVWKPKLWIQIILHLVLGFMDGECEVNCEFYGWLCHCKV